MSLPKIDSVLGQQPQRAVVAGGDELRLIAVDRLGRRPDRAQVGDDVGDCRRREIALQAFRHQRLAARLEEIEIGTQQRVLLSFLFLQGHAGRRFSGQNSGVREAVNGLRGIAAVAFVESPIRIENRLDEPGRRARGERREIGADLKPLVLHAMAAGAVLGECLASAAGIALGRRLRRPRRHTA